jgi:hypothetical protein
MHNPEHEARRVIVRDLLIFLAKVGLDGVKGIVVTQVAIGAALMDLVLGGSRPGQRFYAVLRYSERFDLWLNLYGAAAGAERSGDGLFGASRAGSNTMLGKLEEMMGGDTREASASAPAAAPSV